MKILVVGDWHSELHEEAISQALEYLGHEIVRLPWHRYFKQDKTSRFTPLHSLVGRIQNKLIAGPLIAKINADFVSTARSHGPDVIFIYRGTHITIDALRAVKSKRPHTVIVGYNNDDPFAKGHSWMLWRHFLKAVPEYDLMLAYRHHNIHEFKQIGARRVELLRSWFIPEINKPVQLTATEVGRFECDVVFAGHYEPDGREKLLERIVREGVKLRLFGPEWGSVVSRSPELGTLSPIEAVRGEDYNKALCGAKIALCFFSKLNRDTYTRRCFEIPASGVFMLSEYSDDLARMYREGEEAAFFRSEEELLSKVHYYLGNDTARSAVATAGHRRVHQDGHDVVARMKLVLKWVTEVEPVLKGGAEP